MKSILCQTVIKTIGPGKRPTGEHRKVTPRAWIIVVVRPGNRDHRAAEDAGSLAGSAFFITSSTRAVPSLP